VNKIGALNNNRAYNFIGCVFFFLGTSIGIAIVVNFVERVLAEKSYLEINYSQRV
jgi:hypothetical protein